MRDSSIICLLIFTWLFTAIVVIGADTKMTNFEKRLEEVYGHHDDQLSDHKEQTEQRMTELEARVSDLEHENSIIEARLDIHRAELTNLNGVFTNILEEVRRTPEERTEPQADRDRHQEHSSSRLP